MLNPCAEPFVPATHSDDHSGDEKHENFLEYDLTAEDNITPEELDELECTEEWVKTMAFMEELECDHLIELALRHAPSWRVEQIHKRSTTGRTKVRSGKSGAFKVKSSRS